MTPGSNILQFRVRILLAYGLIPFVANMIMVSLLDPKFFLLNPVALSEISQVLDESGVSLLSRLIPFPIITIVITGYLWPFLFTNDRCVRKYPTRIINSPLLLSAMGAIGWILGVSITLLGYVILDVPFYPSFVVYTGLIGLLTAILPFSISYYALDFLNRRYFIPHFFQGQSLSDIPGTFHLSLRARFIVLLLTLTVYPVTLLTLLLLRIILFDGVDGIPPSWAVYTLTGFIGFVAIFLMFFVSRSFQVPLEESERAVQAVARGDFSRKLNVYSTDEFGTLAEGINSMTAELREKEKIKDAFGRMVDPVVRDHVLKGNLDMGGEELEATVLFTDIRGFTSFSETLNPHEVVELLNRYFEKVSAAIRAHGGLVNKYLGDAVLAVFGVPIPLKEHAKMAYEATREIRFIHDQLNRELSAEGKDEIQTGIGVHTGRVLAGNIGSKDRMEYTIIGDSVNLASRIEGLCKKAATDILISEATVERIKDREGLVFFGKVKVRGRNAPIALYTLES